MTYREAKYDVAEQLKNAGIENEVAESGFLMEFACDVERNFYLLHQTEEMPAFAVEALLAVAKKRCAHIPLQYLTGEQEFMGLTFRVNEHVLIPRQDTEVLVETALDVLKKNIFPYWKNHSDDSCIRAKSGSGASTECKVLAHCGEDSRKIVDKEAKSGGRVLKVLDLCTGSGCIAVSLKSFQPEIEVTASDISKEALAVARENAERLLGGRLNHLADIGCNFAKTDRQPTSKESNHSVDRRGNSAYEQSQIKFIQSDLFSAISGKFDMIVSNPPYIPSGVIPTLMPEVREHEPMLALDGNADGLDFYRKIITQSPDYLNEGGWLLFEIGAEQGEAVSELLREHGFADIEVTSDLAGLDRVVKAHR